MNEMSEEIRQRRQKWVNELINGGHKKNVGALRVTDYEAGMDHGWIDGDDSVPEISEERLQELVKKIRPLIMQDNGKLYKFTLPHLRNTAYTWSTEGRKKVKKKFKLLKTIHTNHSCGYYGFFKPSIAEVLAHVDYEKLSEYGNAFYIDPGYVDIYRSGSAQRATTHFGVLE